MITTINLILIESDLTDYSGEIIYNHESELRSYCNKKNFISLYELELQKSIDENKLNRFCFLCNLLFSFGKDLNEYKHIYLKVIDYVVTDFNSRNNEENEKILTIVLDLLWHQSNGLKNFDIGQDKLINLLKKCANFKYSNEYDGDEIFFAIKKCIDLSKFITDSEEKIKILALFENHFDDNIRNETKECINKNCL